MNIISEKMVPFLFKLFGDNRFQYFDEILKSHSRSQEEAFELQFREIKKLLNFSYAHIQFYREWFDLHGIQISSIKDLSDFQKKIPILTKSDILAHHPKFNNVKRDGKFIKGATGGSTGEPLKYQMSLQDYQMGFALLYRGMGYAGYSFGDKLLTIAGGSLVKGKKNIKRIVLDKAFNIYRVSSYGLTEQDLDNTISLIKTENIKYIRGYASSLFLLAEYCALKGREIKLEAMFSTSEMLLPAQRDLMVKTFNCSVYNQYGLNDGGISAYQYQSNNTDLLVDTERAYLEVAGSLTGTKKNGRIVATSFLNYHFPFIRYDTGDIGELDTKLLPDYPQRPRLIHLLGRETEYLLINEKKVGSPVLTVLMGRFDIKQYKISQKSAEMVVIQIKAGKDFSKDDESFIRNSMYHNCGKFDLRIEYVQNFTSENKHKFIINEWKKK